MVICMASWTVVLCYLIAASVIVTWLHLDDDNQYGWSIVGLCCKMYWAAFCRTFQHGSGAVAPVLQEEEVHEVGHIDEYYVLMVNGVLDPQPQQPAIDPKLLAKPEV